MTRFLALYGYPPLRQLRRPLLWTLLPLFLAVSHATDRQGWFGELTHDYVIVYLSLKAAAVWRAHKAVPAAVEPLGTVTWPATEPAPPPGV